MSFSPPLSFDLEDQFGQRHDPSECAGRVVVILGGDRTGSVLVAQWAPALFRALDERGAVELVKVYAAADLRGVPRWLRGVLRGFFPRERELAVLLDWDGDLARRHDFGSGRCNVLVADRGGAVVVQSDEGAPEKERVERLADVVARLVGV